MSVVKEVIRNKLRCVRAGKRRPEIVAIVLTWNNYHDTRDCINSLLSSVSKLSAIVVVDNGSKDDSILKLKKDFANERHVKFIMNMENLGFAGGVNRGIKFALTLNPGYLFLINNDAIIEKECIKHLVIEAERALDIGIIGPRIFYNKSSRIWSGGGYYSYLKTGVVVPEKGKEFYICSNEIKEVRFLTGCAILIKREVFKRIGFFDEDFFLYEEDVDFCLRASKVGFKLLYVPEAKVWHKIESVVEDRTTPLVLYNMARSHLLLLRKNFHKRYFLYGLSVHILCYTPYRLMQILWNFHAPLKALNAWLRGSWAGLRYSMNKNRDIKRLERIA